MARRLSNGLLNQGPRSIAVIFGRSSSPGVARQEQALLMRCIGRIIVTTDPLGCINGSPALGHDPPRSRSEALLHRLLEVGPELVEPKLGWGRVINDGESCNHVAETP